MGWSVGEQSYGLAELQGLQACHFVCVCVAILYSSLSWGKEKNQELSILNSRSFPSSSAPGPINSLPFYIIVILDIKWNFWHFDCLSLSSPIKASYCSHLLFDQFLQPLSHHSYPCSMSIHKIVKVPIWTNFFNPFLTILTSVCQSLKPSAKFYFMF